MHTAAWPTGAKLFLAAGKLGPKLQQPEARSLSYFVREDYVGLCHRTRGVTSKPHLLYHPTASRSHAKQEPTRTETIPRYVKLFIIIIITNPAESLSADVYKSQRSITLSRNASAFLVRLGA